MRFKYLIVLLFLAISSYSSAQIDPSLLEKAKKMGYSEDQIKAAASAASSSSKSSSMIDSNSSDSQYKTGSSDSTKVVLNNSDNQRMELVNDSVSVASVFDLKSATDPRTTELTDREKALEKEQKMMSEKYEKMLYEKRKRSVFGSDIFSDKNLTFAPNLNIPTPKDYVIASGDEVLINVWGAASFNHKNMVTADGYINIPNVGIINLNGLTINDAEKKIEGALKGVIEGIGKDSHVNVSLGKIRSIKVNVSGEVRTPGTYTVPSLATAFHALYLAGGINNIGSLRDVKVYRNGKKVATLDVYDFIMNGNNASNVVLKDNDNVIISPYKNRVHASGKLRREMIYEMRENEPVSKLIEYAGGFAGDAFKNGVTIYRKSNSILEVLTVDKSQFDNVYMQDGDSLLVMGQSKEYKNRLSIKGAVWREGDYQLTDSLNTLSRLIDMAGGLRGDEFATRGLVTRKNLDRTLTTISFNVGDVVSGNEDVVLQNNDIVVIPKIDEMIEKRTIKIEGDVNRPNKFVYAKGMKVEDLIILAGGLKESASTSVIEIARRVKDAGAMEYSNKIGEKFILEINPDLTVKDKDFVLEPFDEVHIRRSPKYSEQRNITVNGEVVFPGMYALTNNDTRLSDILERVKGLTPEAYIKGVSLKRMYTASEKEMVESIIKLSENTSTTDSLSAEMLGLTKSYSVAINFEKAITNPGSPDDITLLPGDVILVPKFVNTVKTAGAVYFPNATTFEGKKMKRYIGSSGGYRRNALRKPFVVYMNGQVRSTRKYLFFASRPKIEPGCQIVVPARAKGSKLSFAEITTMGSSVTSLATSVALLATGIGKK